MGKKSSAAYKIKNAAADKQKVDSLAVHSTSVILTNDWIPIILVTLFLLVDFVPAFDAVDVMGAQWLYLGIINLLAVIFIWADKANHFTQAIKDVSNGLLSKILACLLLISAVSIFVAANKTESFVCYARFIVTACMYFIIAILLYNRLHLFKLFAQILSFLLLIQVLQVLTQFFNGLGHLDMNELIFNLKGNAGNKNILAASIAIKLPFTLYCIYTAKIPGKVIHTCILLPALLAVSFINARSSYIIVIIELVFYFSLCMIWHRGTNKKPQTIARLGYVLVPLIISLLLSSYILNNSLKEADRSEYGTVTQRLASIKLTNKSSDARLFLWSNAVNYLGKHPGLGCGYGNWKLAALPYEKNVSNDLQASYHVHNDFLEIAAETGVAGGLLYAALFLTAALFLVKIIFSGSDHSYKTAVAFIAMALAAYFTDAVLNFPLERPVMQFFFCFIMAISQVGFISFKSKSAISLNKINGHTKTLFLAAGLLILTPACIINYLGFKSLVAQSDFNSDMLLDNPQETAADANSELPSFPNLSANALPVDEIKARYLINEHKYEDAIKMLNRSVSVNPGLSFNDYLKSHVFLATGKTDSAFYYAKAAFDKRPRSKSNYLLMNLVYTRMKDSLGAQKAFNTIVKLRNEKWVWDNYLNTLYAIKNDKHTLVPILDSAIKIFPDDPEFKQKKAGLLNITLQKNPGDQQEVNNAQQIFNAAMESFSKKDFTSAAREFEKAGTLNPGNYLNFENTGMCYFALKEYNKAMTWYDKTISMKISTDGKAEFFKALCLINLGKQAQSCAYLQIADEKGYGEAKKYLSDNCK